MPETRRFNKTFLNVFLGLCICLLMIAPAGAQNLDFDHDFETGFPLTGAHQTVSCESCHLQGIFIGTPGNCDGCHNGSIAPGKSATHIVSSNTCDDCHSTSASAWSSVVQMDHGSVIGTCSSCHDGTISTGKSATHITSSNMCDECNNTTGWVPATVDHT